MSDTAKLQQELSSNAQAKLFVAIVLLGIFAWLIQMPNTEARVKPLEQNSDEKKRTRNPDPPKLIERYLLTQREPGRLIMPGRIVDWKDVSAGEGNRAAIGFGSNGAMLNYVVYNPSSSYEPLNAQYLVYHWESGNTYQVIVQEYKVKSWASTPYRSLGSEPGITSGDRYVGSTIYTYKLIKKEWLLDSVKVFSDAGADTYYDGWRVHFFGNYSFERDSNGLHIFDGYYSAPGVDYSFLPNDIDERGNLFKEHPERKHDLSASSPKIQELALWKYFGPKFLGQGS